MARLDDRAARAAAALAWQTMLEGPDVPPDQELVARRAKRPFLDDLRGENPTPRGTGLTVGYTTGKVRPSNLGTTDPETAGYSIPAGSLPLAERVFQIQLYPYPPSVESVYGAQTYLVVADSGEPGWPLTAASTPAEIEAHRVKNLIPRAFASGPADELAGIVGATYGVDEDRALRGYRLVLYPESASVPSTPDVLAPFPSESSPTAGDTDQEWVVDYEEGVVRFSGPPSNDALWPGTAPGDGSSANLWATFFRYVGRSGKSMARLPGAGISVRVEADTGWVVAAGVGDVRVTFIGSGHVELRNTHQRGAGAWIVGGTTLVVTAAGAADPQVDLQSGIDLGAEDALYAILPHDRNSLTADDETPLVVLHKGLAATLDGPAVRDWIAANLGVSFAPLFYQVDESDLLLLCYSNDSADLVYLPDGREIDGLGVIRSGEGTELRASLRSEAGALVWKARNSWADRILYNPGTAELGVSGELQLVHQWGGDWFLNDTTVVIDGVTGASLGAFDGVSIADDVGFFVLLPHGRPENQTLLLPVVRLGRTATLNRALVWATIQANPAIWTVTAFEGLDPGDLHLLVFRLGDEVFLSNGARVLGDGTRSGARPGGLEVLPTAVKHAWDALTPITSDRGAQFRRREGVDEIWIPAGSTGDVVSWHYPGTARWYFDRDSLLYTPTGGGAGTLAGGVTLVDGGAIYAVLPHDRDAAAEAELPLVVTTTSAIHSVDFSGLVTTLSDSLHLAIDYSDLFLLVLKQSGVYYLANGKPIQGILEGRLGEGDVRPVAAAYADVGSYAIKSIPTATNAPTPQWQWDREGDGKITLVPDGACYIYGPRVSGTWWFDEDTPLLDSNGNVVAAETLDTALGLSIGAGEGIYAVLPHDRSTQDETIPLVLLRKSLTGGVDSTTLATNYFNAAGYGAYANTHGAPGAEKWFYRVDTDDLLLLASRTDTNTCYLRDGTEITLSPSAPFNKSRSASIGTSEEELGARLQRLVVPLHTACAVGGAGGFLVHAAANNVSLDQATSASAPTRVLFSTGHDGLGVKFGGIYLAPRSGSVSGWGVASQPHSVRLKDDRVTLVAAVATSGVDANTCRVVLVSPAGGPVRTTVGYFSLAVQRGDTATNTAIQIPFDLVLTSGSWLDWPFDLVVNFNAALGVDVAIYGLALLYQLVGETPS